MNVLRECNEMKEEIKNPENTVEYTEFPSTDQLTTYHRPPTNRPTKHRSPTTDQPTTDQMLRTPTNRPPTSKKFEYQKKFEFIFDIIYDFKS